MSIKPIQQRILKEILRSKEKIRHTQKKGGTKNPRTVNHKVLKPQYHHHHNKVTKINKHWSIVTLNSNSLNFPIKTD